METTVLDLSGASEYLKISEATLRAWKRQGKGPTYFRAGKLLRYRRSDLDLWIEKHSVSHSELEK
jgi:excisionase family DNA binding protein